MDRLGSLFAGALIAAASACAHPPTSPPAPSAVDKATPPPADLLDEETPVGYVANEKTGTPACREAIAEFNEAWAQSRSCDRDSDCAIWFNSCTAARADFEELLGRKLRAAGDCVKMIAVSHCIDPRAICLKRRCRACGRFDNGDADAPD